MTHTREARAGADYCTLALKLQTDTPRTVLRTLATRKLYGVDACCFVVSVVVRRFMGALMTTSAGECSC